MIEEAKEHGYHLSKEKSVLVLNEIFMEKMKALQENKRLDLRRQAEQVEEMVMLLDLVKKWGFALSLEEAQNLMAQILDECFGKLEKCWWEDGTARPFPPNLIFLAEKLDFNVERFSKMISSPPPKDRS
jgi:hypothetical protein